MENSSARRRGGAATGASSPAVDLASPLLPPPPGATRGTPRQVRQEPADVFHTPRADIIAVTAPPSPAPAAAAAVEHTDARSGGGEWKQRQLPSSWLLFQQAFWFPQFVGFTLVPNILLPVQVARLVGPGGEGSALGLVNMLIQLSGFTQPFIGAWSDRTARRPFILWGQVGVRAANSGGPGGGTGPLDTSSRTPCLGPLQIVKSAIGNAPALVPVVPGLP